jgi:hypothetical protein
MSRPRPRVPGRPSPAVAEGDNESAAQPTARIVPTPLSRNALKAKRKLEGSLRGKAAERLMKNQEEI